MTADEIAEINKALETVERDHNGIIVLSPYGFKIGELNGKKYLMSNTKEEWESVMNKRGLSTETGRCWGGGPTSQCYQGSCTSRCEAISQGPGGGWYCGCTG